MRGVLERMAQRARGALPMVEPRKTPRFMASDADLSGALGGAGNAVSVFVSAMEGGSRKEPTLPVQNDETRTVDEDDSTAGAMREPFRRDMVSSAGVAAPPGVDDGEDQVESALERRPKAHLERLSRLRSQEKIAPTQQPALFARDRAGTDMVQLPVSAEIRQSQKMEPVTATSTEDRVAEEEGLEGNQPESGEESAAPLAIGRGSTARHTPHEPKISPHQDAVVRQPDVPVESRTEIHISIGSIELRPPPVVVQPRPAPFQPRVTLNDFLGRRP